MYIIPAQYQGYYAGKTSRITQRTMKPNTYLNSGPDMESLHGGLTSFCTKDPRAPSNGNKPRTRINYNYHRSGSNPRSLALNEAAKPNSPPMKHMVSIFYHTHAPPTYVTYAILFKYNWTIGTLA